MQLRSHVTVAVTTYTSDWTPSLGTSICHECSPKRTKRQKKKKILSLNRKFAYLSSVSDFKVHLCRVSILLLNQTKLESAPPALGSVTLGVVKESEALL